MKQVLKKFQCDEEWEADFAKVQREANAEQIYLAFLKVGAEEAK